MSFLDDSPPDYTKPQWREWIRLLASQIYNQGDIAYLVNAAGVGAGGITWQGSGETIWRSVYQATDNANKKDELEDRIRENYAGIAERLDNELLDQATLVVEAPQPEKPSLHGFGGNERQIVVGDDTLLDIAFLETGLDRATAVCRLNVSFGRTSQHGTGFRVGPNQILTNHHVLFDQENGNAPATDVVAWFDYQLDTSGKPKELAVIQCDSSTIRANQAHDWGIIETAEAIPARFQTIDFVAPSLTTAVDDRVYIIQHPVGTWKKIGMHHNLVRHVDDDVIQYWTDTEAGSSGSPVFNRKWELVGLHHQWTVTTDGYGFANQGRQISKVLESVNAAS